jgi:hypothetical protein
LPDGAAAAGELLVRGEASTIVVRRLSDNTVVGSFTLGPNEGIGGVAIANGQIVVTTNARVLALRPAQ